MLLNLSGAHAPFFTRNIVILTDSSGRTGVGEVPGGEKIRQTLEDAAPLVVGQPLPRIDLGALDPGLGEGGHVGQHRRALVAGHGQGVQLAGADLLEHRVHVLEGIGHLAAEQVGDGGGSALVRNVQAFGAGLLPEHLGRQVVRGTVARAGEGDRARAGLEFGDDVSHAAGLFPL